MFHGLFRCVLHSHCSLSGIMLRQLVAGQGCTDEAGPSASNPLAGLFSHVLGNTKQGEYLHEVRATMPTFSKVDRDKIRNRSHIHTRHLFPGATARGWLSPAICGHTPRCIAAINNNASTLQDAVELDKLIQNRPWCRCFTRASAAAATDFPALP